MRNTIGGASAPTIKNNTIHYANRSRVLRPEIKMGYDKNYSPRLINSKSPRRVKAPEERHIELHFK